MELKVSEEILVNPPETGENRTCPSCHLIMVLAAGEARRSKPDLRVYKCTRCGRTERFTANLVRER